jgi:hypothetical protein
MKRVSKTLLYNFNNIFQVATRDFDFLGYNTTVLNLSYEKQKAISAFFCELELDYLLLL